MHSLYTHTHTHEYVELAAVRRVCFNPLKHWQLQQNKEALFECVFAHSLGAHAHRVLLATSSAGYIIAFYIVMENEPPQTQSALTQMAHRTFTFCQRVRPICKRTIMYIVTHTLGYIVVMQAC